MNNSIPHNEEIERLLIGAVLVDRLVPWELKQLSTIDFYIGLHRSIWAAICEMDEEHQPIDVGPVFAQLSQWPVKLTDLMQMTIGIPIQQDWKVEVKLLKDLSSLRTLQKGFNQIATRAELMEPVDSIIEQAESILAAIKQERHKEEGNSYSLAEVYERDVFPLIDKYVAKEMVKVPFGWDLLDRSTNGGAGIGELVVFGANPKSGKSGLILQVARSQAERQLGCYICSREMLNYENGLRTLAQTSQYTVNHFRSGLYAETARRIKDHGRETGGIPLRFDDRSKTVKEIRAELTRLEDTGQNITSVFVDYIQLMRGTRKSDNRAEFLESIVYDLKDLAIERKIVVYANAQFNRQGINMERPKMSNFEGSSAIEKAANIVLLWTLNQEIDEQLKGRKGSLWIEAGRNVAYDEFGILFHGEKALFTFL